jgi:mannose-6-phosphate isomerase-like protein (cupin superfamily)
MKNNGGRVDRTPVLEEICHEGKLLAIIMRASFSQPGVHFVTPDHFGQQLGYMLHPKGKIIEPHVHNEVVRTITSTQEVLVVRRGLLRVDFYSEDRLYLESRELGPNDIILLSTGGHGFEALEELEMIEIKQGPYAGGLDKIRFSPPRKASTSDTPTKVGS